MKTIAQIIHHNQNISLELIALNGSIVYYENSAGWYKRRFDSNDNQISFENSKGYWWSRQYDSNGNQIYFETSEDGVSEDNRP